MLNEAKRNRMVDEHGFTRILPLAIILIVFAAATILTLGTNRVKHRQLELPHQGVLTGRVFCPKCFSSTGLEPTGNHVFRCKNCGFVFGFGNP